MLSIHLPWCDNPDCLCFFAPLDFQPKTVSLGDQSRAATSSIEDPINGPGGLLEKTASELQDALHHIALEISVAEVRHFVY